MGAVRARPAGGARAARRPRPAVADDGLAGTGARLGAGRAAAHPPPRASRAGPRAELLPPAAAAVPRGGDDPRPRLGGVPGGLRVDDRVEVQDVRSAGRAI